MPLTNAAPFTGYLRLRFMLSKKQGLGCFVEPKNRPFASCQQASCVTLQTLHRACSLPSLQRREHVINRGPAGVGLQSSANPSPNLRKYSSHAYDSNKDKPETNTSTQTGYSADVSQYVQCPPSFSVAEMSRICRSYCQFSTSGFIALHLIWPQTGSCDPFLLAASLLFETSPEARLCRIFSRPAGRGDIPGQILDSLISQDLGAVPSSSCSPFVPDIVCMP